MPKLVTDYKILKTIYDSYYNDYLSFKEGDRATRNYVPIDIERVAKKLSVDSDLLSGRLYFHLDKKYRYQEEENVFVHLYTPRIGKDNNAIHFPLLVSVLASLHNDHTKFIWATGFSVIALSLSILNFVLNNI